MIAAPLAVWLDARFGFRFAFIGTAIVGTTWIPIWLLATRFGGGAVSSSSEDVHPTTMRDAGSAYRDRALEPPRAPASWATVAGSAPVLRAVVAVIFSAPALMFVLNWTSQYLVERWQMRRQDLGSYLIVVPILFDLGAVGFGLLASRRERRAGDSASATRATHRDLLFIAAILATAVAFAPLAPTRDVALLLLGVSACGGAGIYVIVHADMLSRVPLERTSSAGGMTGAAQSLGYIIASPLVGLAVDRTHGYGLAMVALGLSVVPATVAFAFWPGIDEERSRPTLE
jgi:MFS family permease